MYLDNCAACHGRDLSGQAGFPSLRDNHWLWSGDPEEIELTIRYGINAAHPDTRNAQMLAFGRDGILSKDEVSDVTEYVPSLSARSNDPVAGARGAQLFAD